MNFQGEQIVAEKRRISVLGSTGSVGCSTLDLVARQPEKYQIEALTANRNVARLAEQAQRFGARLAVIGDESQYSALKEALRDTDIEVATGGDAIIEAAARPADWLMAAIVGAAGLRPTLEAVRRGGIVALANKECLVCSGAIFMNEVMANKATLLPVDSEHNAVFQVFEFNREKAVEKIILTASGGPFRTFSHQEMARVTPEQAVKHPNWTMGAKISVDSATMMNKGLEVIEAYHLFPVEAGQLEILVHPQSVVHSMVAYVDGSVLAQLGSPDMRTPIAYTLGWPERITAPTQRLDLAAVGQLTFETPNEEHFPALRLAREALQSGGAAPTVLNAANEVAVQAFLERRIGFLDIARIVETTLERTNPGSLASLSDVHEADRCAREQAGRLVADQKSVI